MKNEPGLLFDYDPFPHISRMMEMGDDVCTVRFFNHETNEGFCEQFTYTDCYVLRFVRRPIFGGPGRWVKVLDDHKFEEKLRAVAIPWFQRLGWKPR